MIRVIKIFQELVEDKPLEFEKRFLYVTFDIIKEQVDEVKKFGACASRIRSGQNEMQKNGSRMDTG